MLIQLDGGERIDHLVFLRHDLWLLGAIMGHTLRFSQVSQVGLAVLRDGLIVLGSDPLVRGLLVIERHVLRLTLGVCTERLCDVANRVSTAYMLSLVSCVGVIK